MEIATNANIGFEKQIWDGTDTYDAYKNRDYVYEFAPKTEQLKVAESLKEYGKIKR